MRIDGERLGEGTPAIEHRGVDAPVIELRAPTSFQRKQVERGGAEFPAVKVEARVDEDANVRRDRDHAAAAYGIGQQPVG